MVSSNIVAILFSLILFFRITNQSLYVFRDGAGLFKETIICAIMKAIINLVISLILIRFYGMVGILLGTNISYVVTNFIMMPRILYKNIFKSHGVNEYSKKFKDMFIINQKNQGPGISRRNGVMRAKYPYIIFIDCDDYLCDNNAIDILTKTIKSNPTADIVVSDMFIKSSTNIKLWPVIKDANFEEGLYDIKELENLRFSTRFLGKVYKKYNSRKYMFICAYNYEDVYTNIKYFKNCEKFYYMKTSFYMINRYNNKDSLTKNFTISKMEDTIDIIKNINETDTFKTLKLYMVFDIYCFYVKMILEKRGEYSKAKIDKIKKKIKELRGIFKGHSIKISFRYFGLKRFVLYLLSFAMLRGSHEKR